MVGLEFYSCMLVEVIPQTDGWAIATAYQLRYISELAIDRVGQACIDVGESKIGPKGAESTRDLCVETGCVEDSSRSNGGRPMTHEHAFVQNLVIRVSVHHIHRRDELAVIVVVREGQIVVVDGEAGLQAGNPAWAREQSEVEGLAVI